MRYAEISALPGTPEEAKNSIINIVTMYSSKGKSEVPMQEILATLRNEGYDLTPRMVMDALQDNELVRKSTKDTVQLAGDEADMGMVAKGEKENSKKHVDKMARQAMKKSRKP
jgi:hypothetical protein